MELIDQSIAKNDQDKVNALALAIQMHVEELGDFYNVNESGNRILLTILSISINILFMFVFIYG